MSREIHKPPRDEPSAQAIEDSLGYVAEISSGRERELVKLVARTLSEARLELESLLLVRARTTQVNACGILFRPSRTIEVELAQHA